MDIIKSFTLACSFLTILPVPRLEWTERNLRLLHLALPLVGLVVGSLWFVAFSLLSLWDVSPTLRGVLMTLTALAVTGGIHMDGWMDTCDALFSRRDREARLRILSDTHAGAFAVMGCVAVLLLQSALFAELFTLAPRGLGLALGSVPVWSRLGLGLLLNGLPFAKEDGLARTLGAAQNPRHTVALLCMASAFAAFLLLISEDVLLCSLPVVFFIAFALWRRCCLQVFGGIAGDLLGAFVELSETAMLVAVSIAVR